MLSQQPPTLIRARSVAHQPVELLYSKYLGTFIQQAKGTGGGGEATVRRFLWGRERRDDLGGLHDSARG